VDSLDNVIPVIRTGCELTGTKSARPSGTNQTWYSDRANVQDVSVTPFDIQFDPVAVLPQSEQGAKAA